MFNLIIFLITVICFFVAWNYTDKTGQPMGWITTFICGCVCVLQLVIWVVSLG